MTIRVGPGLTMPAALEAVGEYHYPEYEILGYDGEGGPVLSRYMVAEFVYPQGLRNEHFVWWVTTVLQGTHARTFTSSTSSSLPAINHNIVFRNYLLELQGFRRCTVHRPTEVTTRYGYRRHGVTVRITGMIPV